MTRFEDTRRSGRLQAGMAIKKRAQKEATRLATSRRGFVTQLHPLTVKVFGYDILLVYDEDFQMTQWMLFYQKKVGLKVDDNVLFHFDDEWVMFDVLTDTSISGLG